MHAVRRIIDHVTRIDVNLSKFTSIVVTWSFCTNRCCINNIVLYYVQKYEKWFLNENQIEIYKWTNISNSIILLEFFINKYIFIFFDCRFNEKFSRFLENH